MTKTRSISFTAFRDFLKFLVFAPRRVATAWIFEHPTQGLVVVRRYRDDEKVNERDIQTTRYYLDMRGVLTGGDFDAHLRSNSKPA